MHVGRAQHAGDKSRTRRAIVTLAATCVAGVILGAFGVRVYDVVTRPSLFDGIHLSPEQARQTDMILTRLACAFDSVDNATAPTESKLRVAARREIEAVLNVQQTKVWRSRLADMERRHHAKRERKGLVCAPRGSAALPERDL